MERRACKRISTDRDGILKYNNVASLIRISNCSENGLCIESVMDALNYFSNVDIFIHCGDEYIKLSGRVARVAEQYEHGYDVGIDILNPPLKYLELLERL